MIKEKTKLDISNLIESDTTFQTILSLYQKAQLTSGERYEYIDDSKSGLSNIFYTIQVNNVNNKIIVPIFSSEKTITWNFSYLKIIKDCINQDIQDSDLVKMILCPLYFYDKYTGDVQFLSVVNLWDFIEYGNKGKNTRSVYFWNDKLPNQYSLKLKDIKSKLFIDTLPHLSNQQLKKTCDDIAVKQVNKFNTENDKRTQKTRIKNISDGLFAQFYTFLQLKDDYTVEMNFIEGEDDFGIDLSFMINNVVINIDVKSTNTNELKISRNRKETDFYAICTWNKNLPKLEGFLHKYNFWKSSINQTEAPIKNSDEMYVKSLDELKPFIIEFDQIFNEYHQYNKNKMKRGEKLFAIA